MKKVYLITAACLVVAGLATYANAMTASVVADVQSGRATLTCEFADGERRVPGAKVTGLVDGAWTFTNGRAKACTVSY